MVRQGALVVKEGLQETLLAGGVSVKLQVVDASRVTVVCVGNAVEGALVPVSLVVFVSQLGDGDMVLRFGANGSEEVARAGFAVNKFLGVYVA